MKCFIELFVIFLSLFISHCHSHTLKKQIDRSSLFMNINAAEKTVKTASMKDKNKRDKYLQVTPADDGSNDNGNVGFIGTFDLA